MGVVLCVIFIWIKEWLHYYKKSTLNIFLIHWNENAYNFKSIFLFFVPQRCTLKRGRRIRICWKNSPFLSHPQFFSDITNEMIDRLLFSRLNLFIHHLVTLSVPYSYLLARVFVFTSLPFTLSQGLYSSNFQFNVQ